MSVVIRFRRTLGRGWDSGVWDEDSGIVHEVDGPGGWYTVCGVRIGSEKNGWVSDDWRYRRSEVTCKRCLKKGGA